MDADRYTRSMAELVTLGLIPSAYPVETILRQF